jgi:hypothetical protein
VSAEVVPRPPRGPAVWHVQQGRRVRKYDEPKLATLIRTGKVTGAELARREDEDGWQPLFDSRLFRREVPALGDPHLIAGRRVLSAVGGHLSAFVFVSALMFVLQGHFPSWLAIWGVVVLFQALGTLPAAYKLMRSHQAARSSPPVGAPPPLPAPPPSLPSPIGQEAARVRTLIQQQGGSDAPRLLADVDAILKLTESLAAREADLEEQTSPRERSALASAIVEARTRLERADLDQDRRLFERQLEVLQGREEGIAKAVRVLERLRVRRDVAEHQLKQLRLDLSRGAAGGLDLPELSSRLQFIRDEIDAREEVAEIGAERR